LKGYLYSIYDTKLHQVIMMTIHQNDKDAKENFHKATKEFDARSLVLCRMADIDTEENELTISKQEVVSRGKNNLKRAKVLQPAESAGAETVTGGK
jgi:hypothetical protein